MSIHYITPSQPPIESIQLAALQAQSRPNTNNHNARTMHLLSPLSSYALSSLPILLPLPTTQLSPVTLTTFPLSLNITIPSLTLRVSPLLDHPICALHSTSSSAIPSTPRISSPCNCNGFCASDESDVPSGMVSTWPVSLVEMAFWRGMAGA